MLGHSPNFSAVLASEASTKDIYFSNIDHFSLPVLMPKPVSQPVPARRVAQTLPSPSTIPVPWVRVSGAQPVSVPVPRVARAQQVPTPMPVPRVGAASAQPPPDPMPAPRARPSPLLHLYLFLGWGWLVSSWLLCLSLCLSLCLGRGQPGAIPSLQLYLFLGWGQLGFSQFFHPWRCQGTGGPVFNPAAGHTADLLN